jgi:hypothetical protein
MGHHDPSLHRSNSFQGDTNDETANSGRILYVRSVRSWGRLLRGGSGSVFERSKAQFACNSVQQCGHLDGGWNRPGSETISSSGGRAACIGRIFDERVEDALCTSPAHARIRFAQ